MHTGLHTILDKEQDGNITDVWYIKSMNVIPYLPKHLNTTNLSQHLVQPTLDESE